MKEKDTTKQAKLIHLEPAVIKAIAHKAIEQGKSVKKFIEDAVVELSKLS